MAANNENNLVAFVHDVSEVKSGTKNAAVKYFNMTLQTDAENVNAVSFKPELQDTFKEASSSKSPVKITGHKRRANWRDNSIQDIEIGRNAKVKLMDNANFQYQEIHTPEAQSVSIDEILDNGYDHQMVSVTGYINLADCYETKQNNIKKKECYFSDEMSSIQVTLWGDAIGEVPVSGVYTFKNIAIRLLEGLPPVLSTVQITEISQSDEEILPCVPGFEINRKLSFPVRHLVLSNGKPKCPCGSYMQAVPGKLYSKCVKCSRASSGNRLEVNYTIKITIDDIEITVFNEQINEYCTRYGIEKNEEAMTDAFLKDETTSVVFNRNNICVCFL